MVKNPNAKDGKDSRASIPQSVETNLLTNSRRRCCLCLFLLGDSTQKRVQIAHINRDRTDSSYENLAVLCMPHHDEYDSTTSQSKRISPDELRFYKNKLEKMIQSSDSIPHQLFVSHVFSDPSKTSASYLQPPSLSSHERDGQETSTNTLLNVLLDPVLTKKHLELLVQNDFLSKEIEKIENVVVCANFNLQKGKPHCAVAIVGDKGNCDILSFLNRANKWSRVGRIPLSSQRSYEPIIHYIPGNGDGILGVEYVAGSGTGVFQKAITWYRVGTEGLVPLFTYPVRAHVVGWGMPFQRHIIGETIKTPYSLGKGSELQVTFSVEYGVDPSWSEKLGIDMDLPLFSHTAALKLEWDDRARVFVPSAESTANFDHVGGFFNDDTERFLRRYVNELESLTTNGTVAHHKWLKEVFNLYPKIHELDHLRSVINAIE